MVPCDVYETVDQQCVMGWSRCLKNLEETIFTVMGS